MIYDYLIVGAGIGGLSAGLALAERKKRVLMLEKNSLPGGSFTTFKKGRFEFDMTPFDIYNYGDNEHIGDIQTIFQKYGLDISTTLIPFNTRIKSFVAAEEFVINGKFEDFIVKLEEMTPGSIEPIKCLFKIIKEIHEALKILENNDTPDENEYSNFYKYLTMNAKEALEDINIPNATIHRLSYLWIEIGSPLSKLSFIDYAEFMYKFIFKKVVILNNKALDLAIKIVKKYQNKGGKLYYNSEVIEIKEENDLKIVITKDGDIYKAKHVICNTSRNYALKSLIKNPKKDAIKIEQARTLGPNSLIVYLGLNAEADTINLNNYHYYHFHNLNSEINIGNMQKLKHDTLEAIVPNVVNEFASPKGTTILILKTDYYADVFDKINMENYEETKLSLAEDLITKFEKDFNVAIHPYIEEVAVSSPFTFAKYTNSPNGTTKGYMRLGYDNSINRLLSFESEEIPGISFVGSYSIFGNGFDNAFYSGYYIANELLKRSE